MIACYDLARCPPTFDVVAFLAHAELTRIQQGADHLDIRILSGPVDGFRRDNLWPHKVEERVHMRDHVLVPLCHLLPSVRSVTLTNEHNGVEYGDGAYLIGLPNIVQMLRQGCRPLRAPVLPNDGLPHEFITFTLREADHHPLRNSRVVEWLAAARALSDSGCTVYIVHDTAAAAHVKPSGPALVQQASISIAARATLYSKAALNVGISNGPMWMSIFMDAPTLMLRPTTNAAAGCYDDHFFTQCGLVPGSQLPTSPPHQRLVWEEDSWKNIVAAVESMMDLGGDTWLVG